MDQSSQFLSETDSSHILNQKQQLHHTMMAPPQIDIVETLFREAARINSSAVIEAARGNAADASLIFRHALEVISHINVEGQDTPAMEATRRSRNFSGLQLQLSSDDDGFCVYNMLLTFEQAARPTSAMDLSVYSSAIIFNLGLIFHQHAVDIGSIKFYQAADRMYEKCLNILQAFPAFCDPDMDTLLLAALNNRTHIGFKMGTFDSEDHSLTKMREISCMLLFSPDATMPRHVEASMVNEILINSMLSGPGCAACA
ncbi:expressed unknown protein [Seminavis robusta]|uniref:Uncharacterized protein n=1 Tax=Seminavis robusta TaxID=568900 RepID=A0A9N8DFZ9_9STRA|nr:expressed unknown protein [Seminavis robusta]|eukprot:Sro132_g062780.1 n/a (257) ;mRNA; f:99695-100465